MDDWGPRFKPLADIYRPQPDEEEDSEYEFPQKLPPKPPKKPVKITNQFSPSSTSSVGSVGADSEGTSSVPYQMLDPKNSEEPSRILQEEYHETVNPLSAYEAGKESWC